VIKPKLKYLNVSPDKNKEDWLIARHQGLGGSDLGSALGFNQSISPIEVFYEKVRVMPLMRPDVERTIWGKDHEPTIAKNWQYWDGNDWVANRNSKTIIRKATNCNRMIINPTYSWLYANVDRLFKESSFAPKGILEIKTISGFVARMYVSGIPAYNLFQVLSYMTILDYEYSELVQLYDGIELHITPIYLKDFGSFKQEILDKSEIFWNNVLEARKILASSPDYLFDGSPTPSGMNAISHLEPDLIGTISEQDFLKEQYRLDKNVGAVAGTQEDYELITKYLGVKKKIKEENEEKNLLFNKILHRLAGEIRMDFQDNCYLTYRADSRGVSTLRVSRELIKQIGIDD
jgi:predicted phage-related endonuclease